METWRPEFIHRRNVANYTRMLRDAPNAARRKTLLALLDEEAASAKTHGWFPLIG